jgi:hypothetical protein
MKLKQLTSFLILLVAAQLFLNLSLISNPIAQTEPSIFVGLTVAYDNVTAIKQLADQVSSYTNFFIIGNTRITQNYGTRNATSQQNYISQLTNLSQYLYDRGFYFMYYGDYYPRNQSLEIARKWGDRFLGYYAYDEQGGKQLDKVNSTDHNYMLISQAENQTDAANKFVSTINGYLYADLLYAFARNFAYPSEFPLYTSDYALYWFDYKAGYHGIFAEFGWNYSRELNVALCRGAATAQNKEWGVMITHTYTNPPYIESAEELYKDLVLAYDSGAKYIVVFDSDKEWTMSILTSEHHQALKRFWEYIQNNPRKSYPINQRIAYVLPKDYAYGFRGPEDKIWGLWEADSTSFLLSVSLSLMLQKYTSKLDIIYEDALESGSKYSYNNIVYWNDSNAMAEMWPTFSPYPTLSPTPTLSSLPAQSQSPSPSPTPTLSPLPTQSQSPFHSQTPTPSSSPSPTSLPSLTLKPTVSPKQPPFMATEYVYLIAGGTAFGSIAAVAFFFVRRRYPVRRKEEDKNAFVPV